MGAQTCQRKRLPTVQLAERRVRDSSVGGASDPRDAGGGHAGVVARLLRLRVLAHLPHQLGPGTTSHDYAQRSIRFRHGSTERLLR